MSNARLRLFVCGDVMTGRGIDQILAHPSAPELFERWVRSASDYVALAERVNGPLPRSVSADYVWGDALDEFAREQPAARIINLETAITTHGRPWPGKAVHYRMHPANLPCLAAAGFDCCVLANNHVLDWDVAGLEQTLEVLSRHGIRYCGAGRDAAEAARPAALALPDGARLLVFGLATPSAGVPAEWAAEAQRPGVNFVPDFSVQSAERVAREIERLRSPRDRVMVSIHWGGNWGYAIDEAQRRFAQRLIDAGVDLIHGHSSHHAKAIELYRGRLILYGCGDFLNDYEGIGSDPAFRSDLAVMYFPTLDFSTGALLELSLSVLRIRKFRLERSSAKDAHALAKLLDRDGRSLAQLECEPGAQLRLRWADA